MSDAAVPATPAAAPAAPAAEGAPKGGAQAAPPQQAQPKSLKVRDLEFKDESEAYAEIQRGRQSGKLLTEAEKRLKAASDLEKRLASGKDLAKKDLNKAIELLGLSKEEATTLFENWYMENHVKPSQMDPRERENAELKAKLKAIDDEKKTEAQKQKKALHAKQVNEAINKLRGEVEEVLNGKKVPGTRHALRRVADYLNAYQEAGAEVSMQIAVDRVLADYRQEFGEIVDDASPEQLESFLGKERFRALAKKVSQWALSAAKAPQAVPQPAQAVENRDASQKRKKVSLSDFEARLYKGDFK